ncbi:MAG: C4-type zinc ribbon domain-containing protein [Anaerolineales bacterium]
MSRVSSLYRLQQIDLSLDRAHARIEEIDQTLADEEEILQKKKTLETKKGKLEAARKAHTKADDAVSAQRDKVNQTERTLYSGTVRNPKELQDLQQESESLKRYLVTLEDRLLDAMIELDDAEKTFDAANDDLTQSENSRASLHQDLLKERERLTMEIGRCEAEREAAVSDVTAEDLKLYESLRKRFSGMVVTLERDSSCSACGVELARSIRQEIRTGDDLIRCRQCGRILYAG